MCFISHKEMKKTKIVKKRDKYANSLLKFNFYDLLILFSELSTQMETKHHKKLHSK